MKEHLEKVQLLARDLRDGKEFPRSPRETLAGYVLAARALDKCRADLVGWEGEYHSNCPLDQTWLRFAELDYGAYRLFVATGATDDEVAGMDCEACKETVPCRDRCVEQPVTGPALERSVPGTAGNDGGLHRRLPPAQSRGVPLV